MSTLNSYATAPGAQSGCEDRRVRSIERSKAGLFETLAAAGAASTVLGVATGPPSAISSFSQGASAGGAAGPALASAVVENDDQSGPDGTGEQSGGALI